MDRARTSVTLWLSVFLLALAAGSGHAGTPLPTFELSDPAPEADLSRLPTIRSSDPEWDAFANDYLIRCLSVDERGTYWTPTPVPGHPAPGTVDMLWCTEWDAWFLPWVDRGAMGTRRQWGSREDIVANTLVRIPVDKHGYAWGASLQAEPPDSLGGWASVYMWPWPKYNWDRTTKRPTGWEFNDPRDGARGEWTATDVALADGYVACFLEGTITGDRPTITSPAFDVDAFQVPILEIDIRYTDLGARAPTDLVSGLRVYWTTADHPQFSDDQSVGVSFSALPPADYPEYYQPRALVTATSGRYPLYFPMYLHPRWGRGGQRITGLRIVPAGPGAEGVRVGLNYVRATYDVRLSTSNSVLILSTARLFLWSGDGQFLRAMLPKLRRAAVFLNEHLEGRRYGLPCFDWMVGKDGLGGPWSGHGLIGSYWDLLPCGRFDLESSVLYSAAMDALAALEDAAVRRGIAVRAAPVLGPDNRTRLSYRETPTSLRALARRSRAAIERAFWSRERGRFVRNIDANGRLHDYGFLHANLEALAYGVGSREQGDAVLSWLDGRAILGDTSTGADIYHWRFAPRTSTKRNATYYFWPWVEGMAAQLPIHQFGNQMQDGGAVPMTSFLELLVRTRTGKQEQIDRAFGRTLEIRKWLEDVRAAGGTGSELYRAYYSGHPERGIQQGGGPPGGIGVDREFLSDAAIGSTFPVFAFLGVSANEDGVLTIAPALPSGLSFLRVTNVFYHGNRLSIEAGRGYVSLAGSAVPHPEGLRVRVRLAGVGAEGRVEVAGKPLARRWGADERVEVCIPLAPVRIEAR